MVESLVPVNPIRTPRDALSHPFRDWIAKFDLKRFLLALFSPRFRQILRPSSPFYGLPAHRLVTGCFPVFRIDGRGGPRNSDRLLRWDPDQGEGVWNATEETELSG